MTLRRPGAPEPAPTGNGADPDYVPPGEPSKARFDLVTEDSLALHFAEQHAAAWRYVATWGKWLEWRGNKWRFDDTRNVFTLARAICRAAASAVKLQSVRAVLCKAKTVAAVEQLARCDDQLKATVDQWDGDISALNADGAHVSLTPR
jgi:putative DNA primase/helicase